jgi:hypothetical protein
VENDPETEHPALGPGNHGVEGKLDLDRISGLGQLQSVADTKDVGVDRQPRQVEVNAPHHIARLAAHAGHSGEIRQFCRDLTTEPILHGLSHTDQASRLGPEEAGASHQFLNVLRVGPSQRGRIGIGGKKGRRWVRAQRSLAVPGNSSASRLAVSRARPLGDLGRPTT